MIRFQELAILKHSKGMEYAILHAFNKGKEPPMTVVQRINQLEVCLKELEHKVNERDRYVGLLERSFGDSLRMMGNRVTQIEEQPKIKKLLKKQ